MVDRMKKTVVKDYLYEGNGGPITVAELAAKLELPVGQIRLLIEHKYLRIVMEKADFNQTVLACPNQRGLEWLHQMGQPLYLQPFIRLDDVHRLLRAAQGRILRKPVEKCRQICMSYGIPIYLDPIYGELISIEGLAKLNHQMMIYRFPTRHDRATVLSFLLNAIPLGFEGRRRHPLKLPRWTQGLSLEIHRIAQMPQPDRTIHAIALYEAWHDSRKVQECLQKLDNIRKDLAEGNATERRETQRTIRQIKRLDIEMEKLRNSVLQ
jgi:hypothetical protein